jgi:DNA-binding transcriptional MerR regulator
MIKFRRGLMVEIAEFEKEFYSLNELAQAVNMPVSTTHNYKKLFAQWLPVKGKGRRKRYHKDCIRILKYIQSLYEEGIGTQEIEEILSKEFPVVSPQPPSPYPGPPPAARMPSAQSYPPPPSQAPYPAPSPEHIKKPEPRVSSPQTLPEAQSLEIQIPSLDKFGDRIEAVFTQLVKFMKESLDENRRLRERLETLEKKLSQMKPVEPEAPETPSETISPESDIPPASEEPENKAETGITLSKEELKDMVQKMRDEGISWSGIADELNSRGIVNPNTGGLWERKAVSRLLNP